MYLQEEFLLSSKVCDKLRTMRPNFGYNGYGELLYYRTYSRIIYGDFGEMLGQESWSDTVIRVINGVMSIRKDWYMKNRIAWNEGYWQRFAAKMAESMFRMEWLPPGRGLWAMGAEVIKIRGAMALYNCAFTLIGEEWIDDLCWLMDSSMHGVGVGFRPTREGLTLRGQRGQIVEHVIPDTTQGWVESIRMLLNSFNYLCDGIPQFDYSKIRPENAPIKTFGGISSGPGPLIEVHRTIKMLCEQYVHADDYDEVAFKTDLANLLGKCVVSGNVRRSAEIALAPMDDPVFHTLKNYKKHPYRAGWGWMSNNSALLEKAEDFEDLDEIAVHNIDGHDVGYLNLLNVRHGRLGKYDNVREDKAIGINPCGEIPLEHREVCNLAETAPTRCVDHMTWLKACEYATFYCSTVSLLPTHQSTTNAVIARNRRIGVSIMDFTGWQETTGTATVIRHLREGYKHIRAVNKALAEEAGVPESIRVTTVKPGGTVPKLAGRTSGASYPTFKYVLRRTRVGDGHPVCKLLKDAGLPHEKEVYTPNTTVFEYPIELGPARPATEVSVWEQAMNVILLQREWADNAVSNTLYFKPMWEKRVSTITADKVCFENWRCDMSAFDNFKQVTIEGRIFRWHDGWLEEFNPDHEEAEIASLLAHIAPLTKSVSLLPHSPNGIFEQSPEEGITYAEYCKRVEALKSVDWSKLSGSDGEDEKYCTGDKCEAPIRT